MRQLRIEDNDLGMLQLSCFCSSAKPALIRLLIAPSVALAKPLSAAKLEVYSMKVPSLPSVMGLRVNVAL